MRLTGGDGADPAGVRHVLATADAVGGVWTYALELSRGFAERGARTTLAVLGPPPDADQRAEAAAVAGLTLIETGLPLDWNAACAAEVEAAGVALAALADALRPDLVHLNSPALAADARFPAPVVGVAHSCVATWWRAMKGEEPLPEDLAWRAALVARGYAACDALVAPSRAFAKATEAVYGVMPEVVWNSRTPPPPVPQGEPAPFAFTAGRLWDEGKGAAVLDRAAARLAMPLRAAGPTRAPGGGDIGLRHMELLGRLDAAALAAVLSRRPVFVSAARYEPFGLAVLEAAQAGCALVLSDIPIFRELWGGCAVFASPEDDAALAAAVEKLANSPAERTDRGAAARVRAARFSCVGQVEAMSQVYERAGRRRPRHAPEATAVVQDAPSAAPRARP